MGLKRIPIISSTVEKEFAARLYSAGFQPYKDYTTWLKLIDEKILQIIIFADTTLQEMGLYWLTQSVSAYLMFDYRSFEDRYSMLLNEFVMPQRVDEYYRIAIYKLPEEFQGRIQQIHKELDEALNSMNVHNVGEYAYKQYKKIPRMTTNHIFSALAYEFAGDENEVYDVLKILTKIYTNNNFPKKLTRDFGKSWKPMNAFAAREAIEKHDLSIYGEFLNKSKAFNLEYLRKHVPELWD